MYLLYFRCRFFCCVYINRFWLIVNSGRKAFFLILLIISCVFLVWFESRDVASGVIFMSTSPLAFVQRDSQTVRRRLPMSSASSSIESIEGNSRAFIHLACFACRRSHSVSTCCCFSFVLSLPISNLWVAPLHFQGAYLKECAWSLELSLTVVCTKRAHRVCGGS